MSKPKDIQDLHAKRMRVKRHLDDRYWRLDFEHKELWKLQERLELEKRQAISDRVYYLVSKLCDEVEAMDGKVCRLKEKYALWFERIDYWTRLYEHACERTQLFEYVSLTNKNQDYAKRL